MTYLYLYLFGTFCCFIGMVMNVQNDYHPSLGSQHDAPLWYCILWPFAPFVIILWAVMLFFEFGKFVQRHLWRA